MRGVQAGTSKLCSIDKRLALRGPEEGRNGNDAIQHRRAFAGCLRNAPRIVDDAGLPHIHSVLSLHVQHRLGALRSTLIK